MPHPDPVSSGLDDQRRGSSGRRLLEQLLGCFEARHGRGLLLPLLVFFRRLRGRGDQRDPRQSVVHNRWCLHFDAHQLQSGAGRPPQVGDREYAFRRGRLGISNTAIKKKRQKPGECHQGLPGGRPRDPPGEQAARHEWKDRTRRPEFRSDLEPGAVAEDPVAGSGPGSDPRPPADQCQDREAARCITRQPLRARPRPRVVGPRHDGRHCEHAACMPRHGESSYRPCHRAGSFSHQLMPFSAMTSASRLGAISRASWRSMSPRSMRLLRLCVKSCMPSFTDFLM